MEFNLFISIKLHSLFTEHGMEITEQSKNIVRYESAVLHVSLIHNPRENSNSFWIGRVHSNAVEINNQVMREYFDSDLKVDNLPQETFIANVFKFFIGEGVGLLEGNESILMGLEHYNDQKSFAYTKNLVMKDNLEAAGKAWNDRSYSKVIEFLEKIDMAELPESFKQKYRIAKRRLSS